MYRIECTCAKILKVNDTLVGKNVKCPACTAVMVVGQSVSVSDIASTIPQSSPAATASMHRPHALDRGAPACFGFKHDSMRPDIGDVELQRGAAANASKGAVGKWKVTASDPSSHIPVK